MPPEALQKRPSRFHPDNLLQSVARELRAVSEVPATCLPPARRRRPKYSEQRVMTEYAPSCMASRPILYSSLQGCFIR